VHVRPELRAQSLDGGQPAGVLDQQLDAIEYLGLERHRAARPQQLAFRAVEHELTEARLHRPHS
jgi:hypothetical protein